MTTLLVLIKFEEISELNIGIQLYESYFDLF
jgi:hypothetical protein